MEGKNLEGPGGFRFRLQIAFMLSDLNNEHNKEKELAWVQENAALFADFYTEKNRDGALEKEYNATPEAEKPRLIRAWLDEMRKDEKQAA